MFRNIHFKFFFSYKDFFFAKLLLLLSVPPPFFFIDQIIDIQKLSYATSEFFLDQNGWYFDGHFPEQPIFPGVLSIEYIAQTAAFFATYSSDLKNRHTPVYLMSITQARFKAPAKPGYLLTCHVELLKQKASIWKIYGKIHHNKTLIAEAEIMATIL